MKETMRTFSTRDKANTFSIKKKILKLIPLERVKGRGTWRPREGVRGLPMNVRKREIYPDPGMRCVRGAWGGGASGGSPAGLE